MTRGQFFDEESMRKTVAELVPLIVGVSKGQMARNDAYLLEPAAAFLQAVGFEGRLVIKGVIPRRKYEFSAEPVLDIRAVTSDGKDDAYVTSLLERLAITAVRLRSYVALVEDAVSTIASHLSMWRPLVRVQLNLDGECLTGFCPLPEINDFDEAGSMGHLYAFPNELSVMETGKIVGVHELCGGLVERYRATPERDALICKQCGLRVLIDQKVKTHGELRADIERRVLGLPNAGPGPEHPPYDLAGTRPSFEA
jgi:hypothetical protein